MCPLNAVKMKNVHKKPEPKFPISCNIDTHKKCLFTLSYDHAKTVFAQSKVNTLSCLLWLAYNTFYVF